MDYGTQLLPAARFYQQLDAILAAQARQRRRRRAKYPASLITVSSDQRLSQIVRRRVRPVRILMTRQQQRQRDKRRIAMVATMPNFFFIEPAIVLRRCVSQRVILRMISLNQDAAGLITATGAPGHLGDQLEGPLGRAKIRQRQTGVT